ncbi:hypothetical protein MRS44_000014 [Fusarium solani]|uniref:uncharacterized protein n=1 Tax=Fusarium solani TaxID=169388 RepID=UPI0032C4381F|nr:hypothetical protein MRS44_000014 [Fusarium solani]
MSPVPPGGLILVSGANGYIASVTIQVFLQRGYRVRGTTQKSPVSVFIVTTSPSRDNAWMTTHFGPSFELVEVPDIESPGAFDMAIKGVDGVTHIAMNMDMSPQNQAIINNTIRSNLRLLEAAGAESSVKSVVITLPQRPGTPQPLDKQPGRGTAKGNPRWHGIVLYGAAKARGEQEAFEWVRDHKPAFSFNTVVPNVNFGTTVSPENMGYRGSSAVIDAVIKGYPAAPSILPSQWYVDVEDTALLHLGALTLDEGVANSPGKGNNRKKVINGGRRILLRRGKMSAVPVDVRVASPGRQ